MKLKRQESKWLWPSLRYYAGPGLGVNVDYIHKASVVLHNEFNCELNEVNNITDFPNLIRS
jgi:hypothetical protein